MHLHSIELVLSGWPVPPGFISIKWWGTSADLNSRGIKGWCLLAYSFFYIIYMLIWKPPVVRSCLEPHLWRKAFRSLANFGGESCRGGMLQKYGYSEQTTMLYITCNMLPGPMWSWWFRQSSSGGWEAGEMVKRNPGVTSFCWKSDCNKIGNSPDSTRAPHLNRQQYH